MTDNNAAHSSTINKDHVNLKKHIRFIEKTFQAEHEHNEQRKRATQYNNKNNIVLIKRRNASF